jgi:hypothetical protein
VQWEILKADRKSFVAIGVSTASLISDRRLEVDMQRFVQDRGLGGSRIATLPPLPEEPAKANEIAPVKVTARVNAGSVHASAIRAVAGRDPTRIVDASTVDDFGNVTQSDGHKFAQVSPADYAAQGRSPRRNELGRNPKSFAKCGADDVRPVGSVQRGCSSRRQGNGSGGGGFDGRL